MDINLKRRAREKAIAREVAQACFAELQPIADATIAAGAAAADCAIMAQDLKAANVFGEVCARHQLDPAAIQRVWNYVAGEASKLARERAIALNSLARSAEAAAETAERAERRLRKAAGI